MKAMLIVLGLLLVSGLIYVQGAAATQPFFSCDPDHCVTTLYCGPYCDSCDNFKCAQN